ncbi:MAG: hypothetical protein KKF33_01400 [Alphaproteobacteria bacterium]|jgi:hypothetical protein|nr:hypothetical protein [Alphaproteobacteria bacterium]
MSDFDTPRSGLPMTLEAARPRPSLHRSQPGAAFVSQLLAARDNMPPQRARRRSTPQGAATAYADAARVAVKRMPMGYRKTVVA